MEVKINIAPPLIIKSFNPNSYDQNALLLEPNDPLCCKDMYEQVQVKIINKLYKINKNINMFDD